MKMYNGVPLAAYVKKHFPEAVTKDQWGCYSFAGGGWLDTYDAYEEAATAWAHANESKLDAAIKADGATPAREMADA